MDNMVWCDLQNTDIDIYCLACRQVTKTINLKCFIAKNHYIMNCGNCVKCGNCKAKFAKKLDCPEYYYKRPKAKKIQDQTKLDFEEYRFIDKTAEEIAYTEDKKPKQERWFELEHPQLEDDTVAPFVTDESTKETESESQKEYHEEKFRETEKPEMEISELDEVDVTEKKSKDLKKLKPQTLYSGLKPPHKDDIDEIARKCKEDYLKELELREDKSYTERYKTKQVVHSPTRERKKTKRQYQLDEVSSFKKEPVKISDSLDSFTERQLAAMPDKFKIKSSNGKDVFVSSSESDMPIITDKKIKTKTKEKFLERETPYVKKHYKEEQPRTRIRSKSKRKEDGKCPKLRAKIAKTSSLKEDIRSGSLELPRYTSSSSDKSCMKPRGRSGEYESPSKKKYKRSETKSVSRRKTKSPFDKEAELPKSQRPRRKSSDMEGECDKYLHMRSSKLSAKRTKSISPPPKLRSKSAKYDSKTSRSSSQSPPSRSKSPRKDSKSLESTSPIESKMEIKDVSKPSSPEMERALTFLSSPAESKVKVHDELHHVEHTEPTSRSQAYRDFDEKPASVGCFQSIINCITCKSQSPKEARLARKKESDETQIYIRCNNCGAIKTKFNEDERQTIKELSLML